MARSRFDVNTTIKLLETTKQFVGGLKTVDTDDALGSFFLRDAENISLSEYGFIEKRYGLVDDNDLDLSAVIPSLTHSYPDYKVQGYFEYVRIDGFVDQILFVNGRLYLARPDNDIDDNPEVIDGRFHQVKRLDKKENLPAIEDDLFNDYLANFIIDPTKQTQVQTRENFDDLFYGIEEIEAVRIGQILYIFTGVYPIIYEGDGKFYLLPEYIPSFAELGEKSHNVHNANNAEYYASKTAQAELEDGQFLPSFEPNVVFEYVDEAVYPRLPYTNRDGTIFTVDISYKLHESLLPSDDFTGFLTDLGVPKLESDGGTFAEIIPLVYYRPAGAGASNLEWIPIDKESLVYTRRTNFDDSTFTSSTFNTLPPSVEIDNNEDSVAFYKVDFKLDDTRAINQSIRSQGPYKVEIQNMPAGFWDIRVDLVLQTAGYQDYGSDTKVFNRTVVSALSREYLKITFTEDKLEDYLEIDPAGLWTCNRVINHFGKLMAYGSLVNPQTVYVSDPSITEYFPDFFSIDFETDDEQEIQKITPWMNILVVQSESYTWGLKGFQSRVGVDNEYTPFVINPIFGTIAPKSVRPVRNQLYFLSRDGLMSLNSIYANDNQYNVKRLDENIENIVPLDPDAVAIQYDNQYWIHFPNSKDFMTLRYYIDNKSWVKDTYFQWNGLDNEGNPQPSSIVFNGIAKYIRKDGDLFMITNLMRVDNESNLEVKKLVINESIPTDLGESPKTMFETAYMNQGYPFHPKKYLENRFDFTIQNEFNFARNGELYREEEVNTLNFLKTLSDLDILQPNHTYRIEVSQTNPNVVGQIVDPTTGELVPRFETLQYGLQVTLKDDDGNVIADQIAPLSKTATPIILDDYSLLDTIYFKVINNDDDNINVFYDIDLVTRGLDPTNPENYENLLTNLGTRNVSDELSVQIENVQDGSIHRLYVIATSRDDLFSDVLDQAYTLSATSKPPIIEEFDAGDITQSSVAIDWTDSNVAGSEQFRIRWVNLDNGQAVGSDDNVAGTSYTITNLIAGNDYRIYVQALYSGVWSPEVYVDVATVAALSAPTISNITGTTNVTVTYTDPNQIETAYFLQFQKEGVFWDNVSPTPSEHPANSTSATVTIPAANVLYKFRIRAFADDTGEFSQWSDVRQFVYAPAPQNPTVGTPTFTTIPISYTNYDTATEYEIRYKLNSLADLPENWTTVTKTYAQAVSDGFNFTITGLQQATLYDIQYRLKFTVNGFDQYTAAYAAITAETSSPTPVTSTPTVVTFATTYNSITLRVTNNDTKAVTVFADTGNVDPTTSRGTIGSQNGTLDIVFNSLPNASTQYSFSVAARVSDNSEDKSIKVLHTASTAALPVPAAPTGVSLSNSGSDVTLSWNAVSFATTYDWTMYKNGGFLVSASTGSTTVNLSGYPEGTYYFQVRARNSSGNSDYVQSNSITISPPAQTYTYTWKDWDNSTISTQTAVATTTLTYPSNPTRTGYTFTGWSPAPSTMPTGGGTSTAQYIQDSIAPATPASATISSPGNNLANLSWSASSGATSYEYQVYSDNVLSQSQTTSSTSASNLSVSAGQVYFRVRACNSAGCSTYRISNTITVSGFEI